MPISLDELRAMDTVQARVLSFDERNELLDEVLASARRYVGKQPERQVGLMCDYIEEDLDLPECGLPRVHQVLSGTGGDRDRRTQQDVPDRGDQSGGLESRPLARVAYPLVNH
jgi:hypothetical protein